MPVTAAVLRELLRTGMTAEEVVEATERIKRDEEATKPRSAGAERTRRWRERHRDVTSVTPSQSVTCNVTSVTKRHKASQASPSQGSQASHVTSQASQASQASHVTSQSVTGDAASRAEPQASTSYSSLEQKEEPQKERELYP